VSGTLDCSVILCTLCFYRERPSIRSSCLVVQFVVLVIALDVSSMLQLCMVIGLQNTLILVWYFGLLCGSALFVCCDGNKTCLVLDFCVVLHCSPIAMGIRLGLMLQADGPYHAAVIPG